MVARGNGLVLGERTGLVGAEGRDGRGGEMGAEGSMEASQVQGRSSRAARTRGSRRALSSAAMLSLAVLVAVAALAAPCDAATDPADVAALQAFYKALKNPKLLDWPAGSDPCGTPAWTGVQCVQSPTNPPLRAVNSLQLQGLNLGGKLADAIGDLTVVKSIFLGGNSFAGSIPSTISKLTNLVFLGLDRNNFTVLLPDTFAGLTGLSRLYLLQNPLNLPSFPDVSALALLDTLDLTNCKIGGTIPSYLGSLSALTYLGLASNRFTGTIPEALFNPGLPSLVRLTLSNNMLNGTIPSSISSLSSLQQLSLQWNQLSGTIPQEFSEMLALNELTLTHNNLVGSIPANLGTLLPPLHGLTAFNVAGNDLSGPLPAFMKAFKPISYSQNGFCSDMAGGACDSQVLALLQVLQGFGYPASLTATWQGASACPGGQISRPWKGVLCSAGSVVGLVLPNLKLSGKLSPALAQLSALNTLQIQNNSISGPFPTAVAAMQSLRSVKISNNLFTGPPPAFANGALVENQCNSFTPAVPCATRPVPKPSPKAPVPKKPVVKPSPRPLASSPPLLQSPPPAHPPPSNESTLPVDQAPPPAATATQGSSSSFPVFAVVGGVIGVLVVLAAICGFLVYRRRSARIATEHTRLQKTKSWPSRSGSMASGRTGKMGSGRMGTFQGSSIADGRTTMAAEDGSFYFGIDDLKSSTHDFSDDRIVGKGGFATVYKGTLPDGKEVAVKRMEIVQMSGKGQAEFQAEINVLTGVRHRHLVSLLGYVADGGERLLVYEYMSLGPLSHHLFNPTKRGLKPLPWDRRLMVALDVAKGVEYLHHLAHRTFIHRDLKPSNILLDSSFRAKVADFGLVKPTDVTDNFASVETRLAGTFGYLAPEYAATGKVTVMSDVYSYGVILMELITGRRALDDSRPENQVQLVAWLTPHISDPERLCRVVDPHLSEEIKDMEGPAFRTVVEVAKLALHCVSRDARRRPSMSTVVAVLTPLVAKWQPNANGEDEEEIEDTGIDITASLAEEVERWAVEGDPAQSATFGGQSFYGQSGYHSEYIKGSDGYSTMAEHYSLGSEQKGSFVANIRGVQSFAGHAYSPSMVPGAPGAVDNNR